MSITAAKARALLRRIADRRLLVVGDVMLDHYIWGDATRISPEAPVPVVSVHDSTDTVGGAANVANNIAALGASVEVVGAIGPDYNGEKLLDHLRAKSIGFDERCVLKDVKTITKTRVIVRNQQLCRLDYEDAPSVYRRLLSDPRRLRIIQEKAARADGVIFSDYAKGVLTTAAIEQIARFAKSRGKFTALDPKPSSGNEYAGMDLITPNRREAIEMAGALTGSEEQADFTDICARIWERYRPENLVVTLGSDGMLISSHGRVEKTIPTAARQVYDVSGAGDTVITALTLALTSGASLEEAAHFANAAAGVVVGKVGTATVTPKELLDYINGE